MPVQTSPGLPKVCSVVFTAVVAGIVAGAPAYAQSAAAPKPAAQLSQHVRQDIQRHRAMAAAHEAAARCLESGRTEADCLKELQASCKGLAIGKYCGMKHEH